MIQVGWHIGLFPGLIVLLRVGLGVLLVVVLVGLRHLVLVLVLVHGLFGGDDIYQHHGILVIRSILVLLVVWVLRRGLFSRGRISSIDSRSDLEDSVQIVVVVVGSILGLPWSLSSLSSFVWFGAEVMAVVGAVVIVVVKDRCCSRTRRSARGRRCLGLLFGTRTWCSQTFHGPMLLLQGSVGGDCMVVVVETRGGPPCRCRCTTP